MSAERGRLLAGALAAVLLLAFFFRGMDWTALGRALADARILPLGAFVVVSFLIYAARVVALGLAAPAARAASGTSTSSPRRWSASPRGCSSRAPASCCGRGSCRAATRCPSRPGFATIILERLVDLITVLRPLRGLPLRPSGPGRAGGGPGAVRARAASADRHGLHQGGRRRRDRRGRVGARGPRRPAREPRPGDRLARSAARARAALASPARSARSSTPSRTASRCCGPRCRTSRASARSRSSSGC